MDIIYCLSVYDSLIYRIMGQRLSGLVRATITMVFFVLFDKTQSVAFFSWKWPIVRQIFQEVFCFVNFDNVLSRSYAWTSHSTSTRFLFWFCFNLVKFLFNMILFCVDLTSSLLKTLTNQTFGINRILIQNGPTDKLSIPNR